MFDCEVAGGFLLVRSDDGKLIADMFTLAVSIWVFGVIGLLSVGIGILIDDRQGLGLWVHSDDVREDYDLRKLRLYRCCMYLFVIISGLLWICSLVPSWLFIVLSAAAVAASEVSVRKFARRKSQ